MEYIAVVFRSRSMAVRFADFLAKHGVRAEIINTPKEAGAGCGLSVKLRISDLITAKRAVNALGIGGSATIFLVKLHYGRRTVRRIS